MTDQQAGPGTVVQQVRGPRVMLVRSGSGPGPGGVASRAHLLPLPLAQRRHGNLAVLYCGAVLPVADIEAIDPADSGASGASEPCASCSAAHSAGTPPAPVPGAEPFGDVSLSGRVAAARAYVRQGWTVLLREGQVRLSLDEGPVVIGLPDTVAVEVTDTLLSRRCTPVVLVHPGVPSYRVFLVNERFPVALGWPAGVRRLASGSVPLPPSRTTHGPVRWVRPPEPGSRLLCREIDILAALRTVHHAAGPRPDAPGATDGAAEPAAAPKPLTPSP